MLHTLDPEAMMEVMKTQTVESIQKSFPVEGKKNKLETISVYAGDKELNIDDIASQRKAKMNGRTWALPIYADFSLKDKVTNQEVATSKKTLVAQLPYMTRRYSFIVDGTEYQADNQWRLKSGVYSRRRADGGLESQFNLAEGRGFRIEFDPASRKMLMRYSTTNIPLLPVLRALGVQDSDVKKAWGEDLYAASLLDTVKKSGHLAKLAAILDRRFVSKDEDEAVKVIREQYEKSKLYPETTKITLGKSFEKVNGEALLLAASKLVSVNRGTDKLDQRDSLMFKELWTVADHIPERIKNSKSALHRKIRNNIDRKTEIKQIITPEVFGVPVKSFFTMTSLSQLSDQTNPIDMMGGFLRATIMGTGGIQSHNAVLDDAKLIDSSNLGFIDPIQTPEGQSSGVTSHIALGVSRKGKDPAVRVFDTKIKKYVDKTPTELFGHNVAFADQYDFSDGTPKALREDITVIPPEGGDPAIVEKNKVDYILRSPKAMFSFTANLIPFLPSVQANRAGMAARHMEQSISLKYREEPIVQSASGSEDPSIDTWEKVLGKLHSHQSPVNGTVASIASDRITIKDKAGKTHTVQIYDNFPLNEKKSFQHSTSNVKIGDSVKEGQTISDSNYTQNGTLSMGVNLRVGYMSYKSLNFEDGLVISESASKKLTSEHLHKEKHFSDGEGISNLNKYRAAFPGQITGKNAEKLDPNGVMKKGSIVEPGDTIIAAMTPSTPSAEQILLGGIHKALVKPFKDQAVKWSKPYLGVVTDIGHNGRETTVFVKTEEETDVGDKLCFAPDHFILLPGNNWVPVAQVKVGDKVASLNPDTHEVEYATVDLVHAYECVDELLFTVSSAHVSMAVTLDHTVPIIHNDEIKLIKARELVGDAFVIPVSDEELNIHSKLVSAFDVLLTNYTGKVYCVTLASNHILCTKHKDSIHWSGNSGRSGNKGIVAAVIPDDEMPRDKDGNPLEIIMNFSGIPGRVNPGQVLETALGAAADKTGNKYAINNFEDNDSKKIAIVGTDSTADKIHVDGHWRSVKTKEGVKRIWVKPYEYEKAYHGAVQHIVNDAKASETTELFDPATGKSFGQVLVGRQYIIKHMHQIDKKLNARAHGYGFGYDANMVPRGSGKHDGAQRYGELGLYAMLAHGSINNMRDALTYASDKTQDDVWTAIQAGEPLPAPKQSFAYDKFIAYLQTVGLNVEKNGDLLIMRPLGDKQTLAMSNGELTDGSKVFRGKDLEPEKGGIFDEKITGGPGGKKWSHLNMGERMPNPIFEKPIMALLGITGDEYDELLTGNKGFVNGDPSVLAGLKGPAAIVDALSRINVEDQLVRDSEALKTARKTQLDKLNKRVKFLRALKEAKMGAADAYTFANIPVMPPMYRPVTAMDAGQLNIGGVNLLYRDIALLSQKLKEAKGVLPESDVNVIRKELYGSIEALVGKSGSEEGMTLDGEARPSGVLTFLSGRTSPKQSFFHTRLMDRKQDLSLRSVIVPEISLKLDEIGLPRKAAMTIFRPFVVQELTRMGYTPLDARAEIQKGTSVASRALEVAISKRPVLFKRDPVLHKFGIMAFKPRLFDGTAIRIHPLVTSGFNADFDGDQMAVFVPISQQAVDEAYKMMPSNNLFNPSSGQTMYQPTLDAQLGTYLLTQMGKESGKSFKNGEDAVKEAQAGNLSMTAIVSVNHAGKTIKTTPGRLLFSSKLPEELRHEKYLTDPSMVMGKKNLGTVLTDVAKNYPSHFAQTANDIKNLGFEHSFNTGFSFNLSDFKALTQIRDHKIAAAQKAVRFINTAVTDPIEREKQTVAVWLKTSREIDTEAKTFLKSSGSKLMAMNEAGIKPGWDQLKQLVIAPMLMQNAMGRIISVPVTRSYSEGIDGAEYWIASSGARKGLIEKVQSVSEPGALSKQIINTTIPLIIAAKDCNTKNGVSIDVTDPDVVDRFTAKDISLPGGEIIRANTLVTPKLASRFTSERLGRVSVRSPLKCELPKGLCSHCYGAMDDGHAVKLGTNVGVIAGQAIGERGTQLSMRCNRHDTLVILRHKETKELRVVTLESLFNSITVDDYESGVQTILVEDYDVYDGHRGWVGITCLQRHVKDPNTRMLFVKTQLGGCTVAQDNHPLWITNKPSCKCGKGAVRQHAFIDQRADVHCNFCRREFSLGMSWFSDVQRVDLASLQENPKNYYAETDIRILREASSTVKDPGIPGYLVGAYASDGCVRRGNGTKRLEGVPVAVIFSSGMGPTNKRHAWKSALTKFGLNYTETYDGIEIYSAHWASEFSSIVPGYASTKSLTSEAICYSKQWLADYLCGYIDGDGTVIDKPDNTSIKIYTSSYAMLQWLLIIANGLGIRATPGACTFNRMRNAMNYQPWQITMYPTSTTEWVFKKCVKWQESEKVVTDNNAFLPELGLSEITLVREVPNEGLVYDLKTTSGGFIAGILRTSNSFHTGGVAGSGSSVVGGIERVSQLLKLPKTLPGKATLATGSGTIQKVSKSSLGGYDILLPGNNSHYVPGDLQIKVKEGDMVNKGDPLSSGPMDPRELLDLTSMDKVQRYLTDEINEVYAKEGIKRRNIETVVRSITNLAEVDDAGDIGEENGILRGDLVSISNAQFLNKSSPDKSQIKLNPILRGVETAALDQTTDWLARMEYRRLKNTVTSAAGEGWSSNIHGMHPVPGIVYSAEFGKNKDPEKKGPY